MTADKFIHVEIFLLLLLCQTERQDDFSENLSKHLNVQYACTEVADRDRTHLESFKTLSPNNF